MKVIVVDIDGVLCTNTWGEYKNALPIKENIEKINKLYSGNKIILWTSRGTVTKIDWSDLTKRQLADWGVKYHELWFSKPYYDMFIDDRAVNIGDLK